VPAYSTLGWFDDPLLSSFVRYPRAEVARLVFHELAHQVVYLPGDSAFNEAFATVVEVEGVRRWLDGAGTPEERAEFDAMTLRKRDFVALIRRARLRLEALYASPLPPAAMRRRKAGAFVALRDDYTALKVAWGGFSGYDRWFAQSLGNAHLASVGTYEDAVPALEAVLSRLDRDLPRFYGEAKRLAALDAEARRQVLARHAADLPAHAGIVSAIGTAGR
jgi:predicted aminopeptidase